MDLPLSWNLPLSYEVFSMPTLTCQVYLYNNLILKIGKYILQTYYILRKLHVKMDS